VAPFVIYARRDTIDVYDVDKKANGRKLHIVVDTTGLLLIVLVTAASVQDHDGGRIMI